MPKLIDVHTHVQFAAYDGEVENVIERAHKEDIWLVNVGTQKNTSQAAIDLADKYKEGVYATVGLHPIHTTQSYHDDKELGGGDAAKAFTSSGEEFDRGVYRKLANHPKVVAIGECGLDYYRLDEETKDKQAKVFEEHIGLAKSVNKPLMIHCRDAFPDLIKILKANESELKKDIPGVIHFFTGSVNDARELLGLGFYFSFGGVVTFARDYDDAIREIGLEGVVLETDAPYVAPTQYRGKRNEPAYVKYVAKKISEILDEDLEKVEKKTTQNARRVLSI